MQDLGALISLDLFDCLAIKGEKSFENLAPDNSIMLPIIFKFEASFGKVDLSLAPSEI